MAEIVYEGGLRRLRIAGTCTARESAAVREAVEHYGRSAPRLTVDLTGVATIASEVASALVSSVDDVEAAGCRVTILRKRESHVDRALRELHR
ncbi:hypothetical protein GCM10009795_061590 [Nocardioides hankookensis]|uniref:STAS domain-containing protein n=1 Tax=Nocardioides hankookensis TaxID=443157 RepID=A0ABW1LPS0_9ACTN